MKVDHFGKKIQRGSDLKIFLATGSEKKIPKTTKKKFTGTKTKMRHIWRDQNHILALFF